MRLSLSGLAGRWCARHEVSLTQKADDSSDHVRVPSTKKNATVHGARDITAAESRTAR